jgi:hypothetical protein
MSQEDLQMIAQSDVLLLRGVHHQRLAQILMAPFKEVPTGHVDDDLLRAGAALVGECGRLAATPAGQALLYPARPVHVPGRCWRCHGRPSATVCPECGVSAQGSA